MLFSVGGLIPFSMLTLSEKVRNYQLRNKIKRQQKGCSNLQSGEGIAPGMAEQNALEWQGGLGDAVGASSSSGCAGEGQTP